MSTFMAYGVLDLRDGHTADEFIAAFERALAAEPDADRPVELWITEHAGRVRITIFALHASTWLGQVVARLGVDVERAVLGLDHDEYGVEHVVLDGHTGDLLRVHHVYVYPEGEPDEEIPPMLASLPARSDLARSPDGTLTRADALAVASALYGVDAQAMVAAVRAMATAHESLQIVFVPLAPWWKALGVTYPIPDLGESTRTINRP